MDDANWWLFGAFAVFFGVPASLATVESFRERWRKRGPWCTWIAGAAIGWGILITLLTLALFDGDTDYTFVDPRHGWE